MRWHVQMGFIVIPGSKNPEHIKSNIDIFDFELTPEEMADIAKLDNGTRYYHNSQELLDQYAKMQINYEKDYEKVPGAGTARRRH